MRSTADTLLILSAGTAFRAPSATDRFGFGGTPDLKPESSRNFEVGIKSRLDAHQEVTFAAFQNSIDDLIVFVSDPSNLIFGGENQNVDRARIRGIEASWDVHADPWAVHAEASLQDPRDLVHDTGLLRRSKHSFTLNGARTIGRGEMGVELLLSGPRPDIDVVSGAPVTGRGIFSGGRLRQVQFDARVVVERAARQRASTAAMNSRDGYNTAARSASIATRYSFR